MSLIRQTWTLTRKNLLIVLQRHFGSTLFRAFILPIVFTFFISFAKNFFIPPADFGIGHATPIRSLSNALADANAGHDTVAFVNNGFTNGDISNIINDLSETVRTAGFLAPVVSDETELLSICKSSLRGATRCYAAVNFHSSTTQGPGGIWNYTLHADGALGTKIFVNHDTNDQEIYILPFQHAIDSLIATSTGNSLPSSIEEYPFTYEDNAQRAADIVRLYQGTVISILAIAFYLGMVGVTYQLTGHMASERELGMSQLIEAMMPNKRRWEPQVARILAYHLSFTIIYLPSWLINGAIISGLVFPDASYAITIIYHVLLGLALTSYSIFFATFFKKAQLSGITATIISIVLAIIAQIAVGGNGSTGAVAILSLLFPSAQYIFMLIMMARFQQIQRPTNLVETPPNSDWAISGLILWIFAIIQIIVFPILGALVERALYGTGSTDRELYDSKTSSGAQVAVKLTGFNKVYTPGRTKRFFQSCFRRKTPQVHAVKDLTLDVVQGQIAILLGANGSGKSTTLDAIAGLHSATSGTIEVDGREGIGLCPQKNVLWDDVSVLEHVRIFNSLKSRVLSTRTENEDLIAACDLAMKQDARSKTLSGGQKRKLQLAMMFTGGSKVCCIDEVSSGIDPLARRKVWDILLAERGRRTILLTTHFLDEADVLSDEISIMSKGVLKAQGSSVELKHTLGGGYRVCVAGTSFIPEAQFADVPTYFDYDQTVYQLSDPSEVSRFLAGISGNIQYRVQGPTIESVFLDLADESRDDFSGGVFQKGPAEPATGSVGSNNESKSSDADPKENSLHLQPGYGTSWLAQAWILFGKRFIVLRHNYLPYLAAFIIPIIAGGLTTRFLHGFAGLGCSPTAGISVQNSFDISDQLNIDLVYGPQSAVPVEALTLLIPNLNASSLHAVNTLVEFNEYIGANFANVTPGGFFLGETPTFAYLANYQVSTAALVMTIVDNLVSGTTISTQYQSFALPWAPGAGSTLQLILYFGLAMCVFPAFFALYPTAERLRRVRALHYSNGVRSAPLWSAYILFDFIFVMLVSVIVTVLFAGLWNHWYGIGYLFVVFFLYGLTATAFSYVVSLFVTSQLAAFAFAAGTQAVLFLVYLVAYLCIITYAPANSIDADILLSNWIVSLFSPSSSLLRGLLLSLNEFSVTCDGFAFASSPGNIKVYGGPILYLIVQFIVLMTFLIWWDAGGRPSLSFLRRSSKQSQDIEDIATDQDPEVIRETQNVEKSPDSALRVLHLTKSFGSNRAVDNVSFFIQNNERFALLGPNGAGKSTCISLIRGELRPSQASSTDAIQINGISLAHNRTAARNHLGVCPQDKFDAMDTLSVRGHLQFYAKVRGVKDVEHNVNEVMRAVGITQYADRMAMTLSGGNKRKTSLAIALMGNPNCLLLDEPSSGMDAAAKRVMWRVLGGITAGRALLITTHSMEEADALANRAGILARRMLAIGTADELRKAHGDGHHIHIVHKDSPHTSDTDMQRMREWVQRNIAGATVEERTYHGQLRFSVANTPASSITTRTHEPSSSSKSQSSSGHTIRALFDLLETHKEELGIAFYSVSPTTLDQLFLNVVRKHNIAEENSHAETKAGKRQAWWWPFGGKKETKSSERTDRIIESERGSEEEQSVTEEVTIGKGSGASRASERLTNS